MLAILFSGKLILKYYMHANNILLIDKILSLSDEFEIYVDQIIKLN